jgi:hypothetical protein
MVMQGVHSVRMNLVVKVMVSVAIDHIAPTTVAVKDQIDHTTRAIASAATGLASLTTLTVVREGALTILGILTLIRRKQAALALVPITNPHTTILTTPSIHTTPTTVAVALTVHFQKITARVMINLPVGSNKVSRTTSIDLLSLNTTINILNTWENKMLKPT